MKIAHEAPKSIFTRVQAVTDYDYALVHLFESDSEYLDLFLKARDKGREIILDNSIFELGSAFDPEKFLYWINQLKPTWYIVPDVLDNSAGTVENMKHWLSHFKDKVDPSCKMIGSIQGQNYEELADCYQFMDKVANVDKIAITFDSAAYTNTLPSYNTLLSWTMGRYFFLSWMSKEGKINKSKPHHLLGASLIQEFKYYDKTNFSWIDSVDTSSPVVHGYKRILYDQNAGNSGKPSEKLFTLINADMDECQKSYVDYNIDVFRKFCNSKG